MQTRRKTKTRSSKAESAVDASGVDPNIDIDHDAMPPAPRPPARRKRKADNVDREGVALEPIKTKKMAGAHPGEGSQSSRGVSTLR